MFGEIRGAGAVWDVESGGTVSVLVADCQRPPSRARLKPETMTVTFDFSPTRDLFDHDSCLMLWKQSSRERPLSRLVQATDNLSLPSRYRRRHREHPPTYRIYLPECLLQRTPIQSLKR